MQITDRRQIIQDDDYAFPYHYVPQFSPGYTQTYSWPWTLHNMGAMEFIIEQVSALKPESVVDISTGDGRLVRNLAAAWPGARVVLAQEGDYQRLYMRFKPTVAPKN